MDENKLLHALENETNASIMRLTTAKIKEHKNTILQNLGSSFSTEITTGFSNLLFTCRNPLQRQLFG